MTARKPLTIAIMQPYFIPYAGYFRLFAGSDVFVIYDCVQFPRRGWVHRNQLMDARGVARWLTLPLAKAPQDVLIGDLRFAADAAEIFRQRLRAFDLASDDSAVRSIVATIENVSGTPVDYIEHALAQIVAYLGLRWNVVRSSTLAVAPEVRGAARIIEIVRRLGGTRYVNAPGGRDLYDADAFASNGIELRFLAPYSGSPISILSRVLNEPRDALANDIIQSTTHSSHTA